MTLQTSQSKNPYSVIMRHRKQKKLNKLKSKLAYDVMALAKKNREDKSADDTLFLGGLIGYALCMVIAFTIPGYEYFLYIGAFFFLASSLSPEIAKLLEVYKLRDSLTITLIVVTNTPKETKLVRMRFFFCKFPEAPLEGDDDILQYVKDNNVSIIKTEKVPILPKYAEKFKAQLTTNETKTKETIEKTTKFGTTNNMQLWHMETKGNLLPLLFHFLDGWREQLLPASEKVRLKYGKGKVPHATIYALEADPIETTTVIDDEIVDVKYPLFLPFFTRGHMLHYLKTGKWFIPTRDQQDFATYVEKKSDIKITEKRGTVLQKEVEDANNAYLRLLTGDGLEEIRKDVEQNPTRHVNPKSKITSDLVMIFLFVALMCFVIGWQLAPVMDQWIISFMGATG